jgi:hypothetical protein
LADYLEQSASATGLAAPLYLAQAIRAVEGLFREHVEYGGTQIDFVRWLDHLVLHDVPEIQHSDPIRAAKLAQ